MTDGASPETMKEKRPWTRSVEFWSLMLVGLATIVAIATFLGFQVEKHKRLDLIYLAKLSFFNPDIHSSQKVSVLYDGRPISQLTKISAVVINAGGIAIEKRDIERPSLLQFDGARARIIEVHITQKNPPGLEASVVAEPNAVRIEHGLLNPGNSFSFEILLDGDPGGSLPALDSRISGVEPNTRGLPGDVQPSNLLLSRKRSTQLAMIIVATIILGFVDFLAVLGTFETAKKIISRPTVNAEKLASLEKKFTPGELVSFLYYSLPQALRAVTIGPPQPNWLEDFHNIPTSAGNEDAARRTWSAMRAGLKERLCTIAYLALPSGLDEYVRRQIGKMSFAPETGQSALAFIEAALTRVRTLISDSSLTNRLVSARTDMLLTTLLLIASPFATIPAIALWQLFFAGR